MTLLRLGLRARIVLAFVMVPAVFSVVGLQSWRITGTMLTNLDAAIESESQIRLHDDILRLTNDMDQAARGFLYTNQPEMVVRFDSAAGRIDAVLAVFRRHLAAEPDEAAAAATIEPMITSKIQAARAIIAARQGPGGQAAAIRVMMTGRNWRITEQIRGALNALQAEERREMQTDNRALAASLRSTRVGLTVAVTLTLLVTGLALLGIVRELRSRNRAKSALASSEAQLRVANDELRDLYDNAPCGYHSIDATGLVVRMNDAELAWLGYTREEVVGRKNVMDLVTPEAAAAVRERVQQCIAQGALRDVRIEYVRKDGTRLPALMSATAIYDGEGRFLMTRSVVTDVTEIERSSEVQARLITDLRAALASVKTLSGLLPICANCKKVRDDTGYWNEVEQYVSEHTTARFSHGVCPECFPKLFPDVPMTELEAEHA